MLPLQKVLISICSLIRRNTLFFAYFLGFVEEAVVFGAEGGWSVLRAEGICGIETFSVCMGEGGLFLEGGGLEVEAGAA